MSKIKEKISSHKPKVLHSAARIPKEAMRRGVDSSTGKLKEQVREAIAKGESPEQYAGDKIEDAASEAAGCTGQAAKDAAGKLVNKIKTRENRSKFDVGARESASDSAGTGNQKAKSSKGVPRQDANAQAYKGGKEHAKHAARTRQEMHRMQRRAASTAPDTVARQSGKNTIKTVRKGTIKTTSKSAVKTSQVAVKSASRSVKTAQHSVKVTARATKVSAQAAARAAKAAAKAAAQAAKVTAKAVATAIKAIIAALKGLIAAIAAGGWVAVVIILAIGLIAAILCSAFGVFYSNGDGDTKPMTEAILQIDSDFKGGIDAKIAKLSTGEYDQIKIVYEGDMDGDSPGINNWTDVLGIYAVMLTTDQAEGMDVITVTPEKIEKLKSIFNEMNTVSYRTEVKTEDAPSGDQADEEETTSVTTLYIYVKLNSLSYEQAAEHFRFTADQMKVLEEMMSPAYYPLFASLMGVDVLDGVNLTDIISGLPSGTMGADVIKAAATKLGCPYVWGAKGPNKFDCSGLVYWAVNEVDSTIGSRLYTSAAGQAKWCNDNGYAVGRSELQPGDLVFWQNLGCPGCDRWKEVHHTGIYIGDGKVLEASSSKGRVLIRNLWESSGYPLFMFARPFSH